MQELRSRLSWSQEVIMGFSKWAKQAQKLASQHSDKVHAGIDKAATTAKQKSPDKSGYIDKAVKAAKSAVPPKH
jgi:hypothetical protein